MMPALDLRSLALFRIVLGATILVDLADRARALHLHGAWAAPLFVATACAAVALLLGVRTRAATAATLVLTALVHASAPLTAYKGDELVRALLFWTLLLPVGARLSLDARRLTPSLVRASGAVRTVAAVGLVLQIVALMVFSGLDKLGSPAWRDGTTLAIILDTNFQPTALGVLFRDAAPALLAPLTWAALAVELFAPLLLLTPWWRARVAGALALFGLVFGIALTMDVGLFPLIVSAACVALVPTEAWSRAPTTSTAPLVVDVAPDAARGRRVINVVAGVAIAIMMVTSTGNLASERFRDLVPRALSWVGLNQRWAMFYRPDHMPKGWISIAGTRTDVAGAPVEWDVVRAQTVREEVPPPLSQFLTFRERRILENGVIKAAASPEDVAAAFCRKAPVPVLRVRLADLFVPGAVTYIEMFEVPCPR